MREYATDGERVGDGAEQCAVAVAIGAAQHVLTEYARDQLGPFVAGGAGVEFGDRLGRIVGSGGLVVVCVFGVDSRGPRHDEMTQGGRGCEDAVVGELVFARVRKDGD